MSGDPDTWYLLRGLTREAAHWGGFVATLGAALPGARLVPLDLPGAGARHAVDWRGGIADAVEVVRGDAPPAAGRRFVLGVSLGGMVALEWAARHPGELAGIVVGASSARDVAPFWKRMRPAALSTVLAGNLRGDLARREAAMVRTVSNRRDLWDATTAAWIAIARARPVSRATARAQLVAASRWRAPAALAVPALFLVGATDRLVHADCSRALAARYAAPLREHATAGHDLTTDAGEWVAAQIAAWVPPLQR